MQFEDLATNAHRRISLPCSIGIREEDFIHLDKKPDSVSGVGTAKAEGVGTIHWKVSNSNSRTLLDMICIENALYVPSMDLQIISVAQWGKQCAKDQKDGWKDLT